MLRIGGVQERGVAVGEGRRREVGGGEGRWCGRWRARGPTNKVEVAGHTDKIEVGGHTGRVRQLAVPVE